MAFVNNLVQLHGPGKVVGINESLFICWKFNT